MAIWDDLQQTDQKQSMPVFMAPNYRPLKSINGRLFRTNINVEYKSRTDGACPSNIYVDMGYRSNPKRAANYSTKYFGKRSRDEMLPQLESSLDLY